VKSAPARASADVRVVEDQREWDGYITANEDGHLLQSYAWGEFKARYGWSVERFVANAGGELAAAQVLWRNTPLGAVGYIPRGPATSASPDVRATQALLTGIAQRAASRKAILLKAEPNRRDPAPLPDLEFRPSTQTVQPVATLMIDLQLDLDELSARQHPKTRYNVHLAIKKSVRVRHGDRSDIAAFSSLMEETGQRNRFAVRSSDYYRDAIELLGDNAELLLAEHDGDLLAGMLLAKFNGEAIYLYGASTSHKRNLMPTHLLQWEAIRRAKEQGLLRYDMWAVPAELAAAADANPNAAGYESELPEAKTDQQEGLWGVYRFKRGFGGRLIAYCGAYDYVYNAPRYWLWQHAVPRALALLRRRRISEY
jgi:peptidoglycan pentaglycine glycine transferase (the first glycine)